MTTKDAILHAALQLFSERGYDRVSMRDLAAAVGIKAASIYNHFASKEEIFNSLLAEMQQRYEQAASVVNLPKGTPHEAGLQYVGMSEEHMQQIAGNLFRYFAEDEFAAPFRKMLSAEQSRNSVAGAVFREMFIKAPLEYQTGIFQTLIEQGAFIDADPGTMALHFYAPIFLLLVRYDGKPGQEISEALKKHVSQFSRLYVRKEADK